MNIYMIQEQGESRCWKATTMEGALSAAWSTYKAERLEYYAENDVDVDIEDERQDYERSIVESCTLIGELANP